MESERFRSLGLFVNKRQLATEKCAGRRKQLTKKYVWRVAILVMHPFSPSTKNILHFKTN